MRLIITILLFTIASNGLLAQNEYVTVKEITLEGNKRTKTKIALREMDFEVGDTISTTNVMRRIERNHRLLMNADLFNQVEINITDWSDGQLKLNIKVVEDWYLFPLIVVSFADRNFNVWWVEQNRALNRVNLGLYLIHTNFTGRKDYFKAVAQIGYLQGLNLYYSRPYLNKAQTIGVLGNIFYTRSHDVGYRTKENVLEFHREDDEYLLRRFYLDGGITYRPENFAKHQLMLNYRDYGTTETVTALNPDFFLDGATRLQYLALDYQYIYDKRDFSRYPMKGYFIQANVLKEGFGVFNEINSLYIGATYGKYWKFGRFSTGGVVRGRLGLINQKQPFYNSRALGYFEDFIRGYEYYVIDGQDYVFGKAFTRFELLNKEFNWGKFMLIKAFKKMPLRLYLKAYTDHGYVHTPFHNEENSLTNTYLRSGGLGLDIVMYHDYVYSIEYSVNHLNEGGIYLHYKVSF
ncbi:MAG: POTRA domain-containing protein [Saprospiraceae bacterium]